MMLNERPHKGKQPERSNTNWNLEKIAEWFDPESKRKGERPTLDDITSALKASADGKDPTVRDLRLPTGALDGRDLFPEGLSPDRLMQLFDICLKGARREMREALPKLNQIDAYAWQCFTSVIEELLTDGSYRRRSYVLKLNANQRRQMTNQLEQLATEVERQAGDFSRYYPWLRDDRLRNFVHLLGQAPDIRACIIAIEDGKVPEDYYDPRPPWVTAKGKRDANG